VVGTARYPERSFIMISYLKILYGNGEQRRKKPKFEKEKNQLRVDYNLSCIIEYGVAVPLSSLAKAWCPLKLQVGANRAGLGTEC
jgi:hypothetical protein